VSFIHTCQQALPENTAGKHEESQSTVNGGKDSKGVRAISEKRQWLARLDLCIDYHQRKSRLKKNAGVGPLRLLRPYYPEGPEHIHLYLVHPPGGLVCGDQLMVNIHLERGAQALVTTPSAGKIYRSDQRNSRQTQTTVIHCAEATNFEWLPQETIVYSGANGVQNLVLETEQDSSFVLWEITALGRPAVSKPFNKGTFQQSLQINLRSLPVFVEKLYINAQSHLPDAPWGLDKHPVYATMLIGYLAAELQQLIGKLREDKTITDIVSANKTQGQQLRWTVTSKDKMIVVRVLAQQSEPVKAIFHRVWAMCRPLLHGKQPYHPRIWST